MELRVVTLEELKKQVREDFEDNDDLLTLYGVAAEDYVIGETRRTLDELVETGGGEFPAKLKVAVLLLAAHLYRCREAVSNVNQVPVPYAMDAMVKAYVKLTR